jgi:hypothetical protein
MVITGTSQSFGYDKAMKSYCYSNRLDENFLADWARPITDRIREWAEGAACLSGEDMVDCNKYKGRKDDLVKKIIKLNAIEYGKPILVFKSMENCFSFYRSQSAKNAKLKGSPFRLRSSKCLHFYIYFTDEVLGLICLRIQSYAPFAIQYIMNGHHILEKLMLHKGLVFSKEDNCFTYIKDQEKANGLSHSITGPFIVDRLNVISKETIPLTDIMPLWYRFTVRQIEFSTDVYTPKTEDGIRKTQDTILQLCFQQPDDFITYLTDSKRPPKKPEFSYRNTHLGICAKFHSGTTSIKVYHKRDEVLRIETSCYNLRKLRVKRTMKSKSGELKVAMAPMTRSLTDIGLFIEFSRNANNRMRERLAIMWSRSYSHSKLQSISQRTKNQKVNSSGINVFDPRDSSILEAVGSPQFDLSGFKRSDLLKATNLTPGQGTYALRRLKAHKLIKKINGTNHYFPTKTGRSACITVKTLQNLVAVPIMAA